MRSLLKVGLATLIAAICLFGNGMSLAQQAGALDQLIREYGDLQKAGQYSKAIPVAEKILAIQQSRLGPDDLSLATWLSNLGELYRNQGRYADAEPVLRRSLAIREKVLGQDHLDVGQSLNNLAMLYQSQAATLRPNPCTTDRR